MLRLSPHPEHKGERMGQPRDGGRHAPHSLTPIQLEGASDAQELAKMRSGSGVRVVLLMLAVVLATLGGARLLRTLDSRQAYATAAAQLERSDTDQRDAFMRCALPTYQRSQLALPNALGAEVERATERLGKNYAEVLASCAPLLESFEHAVKGVQAPADVRSPIDTVAGAAQDVGNTWHALEEALRRPGPAYDRVQAAASIDKINAAWHRYLTARDQAKQALSARL
jgi:hypothetical protein